MMTETIGALTMSIPSDREIVLTRAFEAPRDLVFETLTRPEHLRRWWGLRGSTLTVCDVDLRPGGTWRFVTRSPHGGENPFTGVYKEITPPERLVFTLVYDVPGAREHPGLVTDVFTEEGGWTTLVETMLFPSKEARDGLLSTDMKHGSAETFDRLAELLASLKVKR
jgi:uncharacterized protein YndB with AHSA1/START domain